MATGHIPEATVARLPVYLRSLTELAGDGQSTTSSDVLAELAGVNAAKVRKDLSYLGTHGTRGVGYDVRHLVFEVSRALGVANTWPVVVCGLGNLGRALANHTGFTDRGFPVVAAVDVDPGLIGSSIDGVPVHSPDRLAEVVADLGIAIGVIATPGGAAQETADRLVAAGIRSILDFSSTVVSVPDDVEVRAVDLSTELQILGFHLQRDLPPPGDV
ncbi:MAG: redox-sensing transcriptional repressor Rex [Acidimicrobiales bacterium]|nr:MAG: redox-sensing transcriptional repressor Rex [Acidimicrobiales bacterium]